MGEAARKQGSEENIGNRDVEKKEVHLNWKKIALIGTVPILLIFLGFFLVLKFIGGENYSLAVDWFDERFGLTGIFLYVYIVDTLILPLSPDFVYPIVASMSPWIVIPVIGTASALGGITSYAIGLLLHRIPIIKRYTEKAEAKWGAYIRRYGIAFVIIAGIFPLPFSTICVLAGALKMDWHKVVPATAVRFVRAAVYFALFRAGLLII